MIDKLLKFLGHRLAKYLSKPLKSYSPVVKANVDAIKDVIQVGDVLLVEGELRVSSAIKYLTQSTWSHAALYVGELNGEPHQLIEADMQEGVRTLSLDAYKNFHLRICRPVHLKPNDADKLVYYMQSRLGHTYDLDNIIDLIRYLMPHPPVPNKYRRDLLKLGSGEPTQAICSSLIAQAFQRIEYPILPIVDKRLGQNQSSSFNYSSVHYKRHHSLFVPRDFDLSPYFKIIKPSIESDFDYSALIWQKNHPDQPQETPKKNKKKAENKD